jgi:hypothetical protein
VSPPETTLPTSDDVSAEEALDAARRWLRRLLTEGEAASSRIAPGGLGDASVAKA